MSHPDGTPNRPADDPPLGAVVHDLSQQIPELVRSEIRLAQAELAQKGKHAGIGLGLFTGAGLFAFFGLATLIATAILALGLVVAAWLAALLVALLLLLVAGGLALSGRTQISEATPPAPQRAVDGVKEDIATVKGERG